MRPPDAPFDGSVREMVFETLKRYPRTFKVLVASALIENVAFGLIIPYLTLYMLFDIGISEVMTGIVLMTYTVAGVPAMIIGGMLADRIGRKPVLLASLVKEADARILAVCGGPHASILPEEPLARSAAAGGRPGIDCGNSPSVMRGIDAIRARA